jgi:homoserine dehydrogenase
VIALHHLQRTAIASIATDGFQPKSGTGTIRVAMLGCGTVGGALARLLIDARDRLRQQFGIDVLLTGVLVRNAPRERPGLDADLFTDRFDDILSNKPDVVIEALGGREPAHEYIRSALASGITVITANKSVVAHHGPELQALADRSGAKFAYEACVGAAVPVIAALRQRAGDPLVSLRAVLNGTCNFVLSRIRETGQPLHSVLAEAIERGFAEPDPSTDISGRDSAEKLCILAREAGLNGVGVDDIEVAGIKSITPGDVEAAREQGCVVKLVGEVAFESSGKPSLRVCPMFVPFGHPLAKANGAENVFVIEQLHSGRLVLQGEGAGPAAAAAALLGDFLRTVDARPTSHSAAPALTQAPGHHRSAYVRLPASHDSAGHWKRRAKQIHVRRDSVEVIVEGEVDSLPQNACFTAAMLDPSLFRAGGK